MAKTIFKKALLLLLVVSMLVTILAACGDDKPNKKPSTTTNNGTGTTDPSASYPAQLEGMKDITNGSLVSFYYVEGGSGTYTADSIWIDTELDGDIDDVDQGVIERNNKVYEKLGVEIEAITNPSIGIGGLQEETKTIFDSQLDTLDVYCGYQYYDISLATQGHLVNLNTLTNAAGETLIDVEKSYWATNYIDSITYGDNLYWVTGDLSLRYTGGLYCTYVNTEIYDQKVKSSYGDRTIYQIVNDGDWHMQTMIDMASLVQGDADHSGKIEDGEIAGFVYESNDIWDGMAFGCKVEFSRKTENKDGSTTIEIRLDKDKKAESLAKFFTMLLDAEDVSYNPGDDDSKNMMNYFAMGYALFAVNKLYMSPVYLSDMENFAIVPTPKLNKDEKQHGSGCHDSLTIFGISKYSDVQAAAAATLELMAYYGSILVTPVFYEKTILGSRTLRDDESIAMIETIRKGFDSDFAAAWSNNIDNIVHIYRSKAQCKNFKTQTSVRGRMWRTNLTTLLTKLDEASVQE